MQKRLCSQTFTVCRTLLLWELIFVQVEGKKKTLLFHWIVSRLGAFASWELLTWGHLLWYFLFCTVVPWSVWNALGNFTSRLFICILCLIFVFISSLKTVWYTNSNYRVNIFFLCICANLQQFIYLMQKAILDYFQYQTLIQVIFWMRFN